MAHRRLQIMSHNLTFRVSTILPFKPVKACHVPVQPPHSLCWPLWRLERLTWTILFLNHLTNWTAETRSNPYFLRYHSYVHQNFTTMSLAFDCCIRRITIIGDESVASAPHVGVCTSKASNGRMLNAKLVQAMQLCCHAFIIPVLDGGSRQA
jgi:hypothetical protein